MKIAERDNDKMISVDKTLDYLNSYSAGAATLT